MKNWYDQYRAESSETSSINEGELKKILTSEGFPTEEGKEESGDKPILKVMPTLPKEEDMKKARLTPEYDDFVRKFDAEYGKGKPKEKKIEETTHKLDTRYKVMSNYTEEVSKNDCEIQLYKNKILKDLDDVVNDLQESHNIITILANDRKVLKDHFAIFNIQIKGLTALNKSYEDDLSSRDKYIETLKAQIVPVQAENERIMTTRESEKKQILDMKAETLTLKKETEEAKNELARAKKKMEQHGENAERYKKEAERYKQQLADKTKELEAIIPEAKAAKEAKNAILGNDEALKQANALLTQENAALKEAQKGLIEKLDAVNAELKDCQGKMKVLEEANKTQENQIKELKVETKDLKPDNDNLTKKLEEMNNDLNNLLEQNAKLAKEPQELKENLQPRVIELTTYCENLKEERDILKRENELLKKDIDEIVTERKKRNAERRKKKEDYIKKVVEEANKKLEENKKNQESLMHTIDSSAIVTNMKKAKEDLENIPGPESKTPDVYQILGEEDMPDIGESYMPQVDMEFLQKDVPSSTVVSARRPVKKEAKNERSSVTPKPPNFFEVREPKEAKRAPFQTIAAESVLIPPPAKKEPQFNPTPEEKKSTQPEKPKPKEEVKKAIIQEMPKPKEEEKKVIPQENPKPKEEEKKEKPFKPATIEELKSILDKQLKPIFTIEPQSPGKLSLKLPKGDACNLDEASYKEILNELAGKIVQKENISPEDTVKDFIAKNEKELPEMILKKQEQAVSPSGGDSPNKSEVKFLKTVSSQQKEEVKENRIVEAETQKATWVNTHFIFAVECTGTMTGTKWLSISSGFKKTMEILQKMEKVSVTVFSFHEKINMCAKELDSTDDLKKVKLDFKKGPKAVFEVALDAVIESLVSQESGKLKGCAAVIFLIGQGKGGPSNKQVERLSALKKEGKKILFYSFSIENEADSEIEDIAKALNGEHYRVLKNTAIKTLLPDVIST